MISLAALAVFSGLSLNLLLSFALGTVGVAGDAIPKGENKERIPLFQLGVLFISVLILWLFFTYMIPSFWRGFSEYFLFFPLSSLMCMGFEFLGEQLFPRLFQKFGSEATSKSRTDASSRTEDSLHIKKVFPAFTAYDGLVPASLLITFSLAGNFSGAVVLALFFVLGNLFAMLILNEIRRRSTLEWVPRFLRGSPLVFISMGLLSLISASAAGICFKILDVFR